MLELNGKWKMKRVGDTDWQMGMVPGTVYTDLLNNNMIDPYFGENEYEVKDLSGKDYIYKREFRVPSSMLENRKNVLVCEGIDTIADIRVNAVLVGTCENMHREYCFDVTQYLTEGKNFIEIYFHSPLNYAKACDERRPLWGVSSTVPGYQHIRKAHSMFGWDWGPKLPDMGIWRDIYIEEINEGRIVSAYIRQNNSEKISTLTIEADNELLDEDTQLYEECVVKDPEGKVIYDKEYPAEENQRFYVTVESPRRWWPNGYGEQPLYKVILLLKKNGKAIWKKEYNCGIRDFTVVRKRDCWGEGFTFSINGVEIFAKGANYIPEDSILGKRSRNRTYRLLSDCVKSNFNCIRVWGGGCYPDNYFYDICDELGLIVWQDFMFACAVYDLTDHFRENIATEFKNNIIRLRNHPSLGMWCGNNEMEMAWLTWDIPENEKLKQDYLIIFERLIPSSLAAYDPDRFYWPSSPSSGGGFDEPYACNRGDTHYWDVWHGKKPFEDIEEKYFRFSSEYGFEAVPDIRTLRTVISDDQLNILSPQMEVHQKCIDNGPGNVTLMYYLFQYYQYPGNFKTLIYATQSLQADFLEMAIRHFRSHREQCSGSTYWQVNDVYPTVSWSTIDYYGRWKGAHYIVKRSYAPVIIYTEIEEATHKARVFISGEHSEEKTISVLVQLMDQEKGIIYEKKKNVILMPFSSAEVAELDIPRLGEFRERECFLHYEAAENGYVIDSCNRLLCRPKKFPFRNPRIEAYVQENNGKISVAVRSDEFARRVEIRFENTDVILSDNFFDLLPGESKTVLVEEIRSCGACTDKEELQKELQILSNYDIALQSN